MRVAYIRVSSVDQNLDRQRLELDECKIEKWFEEKASGKDTERPELKRMQEFLREGDTLYISDFSRLARSVVDLLRICDELNRKNVKLVSMKEKIDTNTNEGRLMLTVIGAIAEFERSIIRERQAEGIAIAKLKGRYAGRKPMKINQDFFDECYRLWRERKMTLVDLAKRLNISRSTAYRLIKQREEKEALQELKES